MPEDRRTLLKVITGALGAGAAAAIGGPAIRCIVAPFGKITVTGSGEFVPVCAPEAVPDDGTPLNVEIVLQAPRDAWAKLPPTTVGSVFLRRLGDRVLAYSSVCPHLGCGIDYSSSKGGFGCPCHESVFGLDGQVAGGPSPRPMDELETRIAGGKVEVRYQKFKIGTAEKAPA